MLNKAFNLIPFKNCKQLVLLAVFLVFTFSSFRINNENFDRISLTMQSKKVANGKLIITNSNIYYNTEGKMVTHVLKPFEAIIINNTKGDLSIYNPTENQVYKEYNFTQGTETSSLYFFLKDKNNELGLRSLGFKLSTSKFENGLLITTWLPPAQYMKLFSSVELVYQQSKPIFLKFINNKNFVIKRSYYYNYTKVLNYHFPLAITHIEYSEKGDSTIEKTVYSNIRVNESVNNSYFDYTIPANAKVIKNDKK
jgi:outer membrane lipoprotein-sorting protein